MDKNTPTVYSCGAVYFRKANFHCRSSFLLVRKHTLVFSAWHDVKYCKFTSPLVTGREIKLQTTWNAKQLANNAIIQ